MIVHRFCSDREYQALMRGEVLTNKTNHSLKFATDARGFCFFADEPEEAKHRLSGIVDFDWCLTFDVNPGMLKKYRGCYPRIPEVFGDNFFYVEYCCKRYSKEKFKLIGATDRLKTYCPGPAQLKEMLPMLGFLFT